MAASASTFHRTVVDDVIKNMRADFANEGLDDQVLDELKQMWENKLIQTGAYDFPHAAPAQNFNYDINYNYLGGDTSHAAPSTLLPMTHNSMYNMSYGTIAPRGTAPHLAAMNALRSLNAQPSHTPTTSTTTNSYGFDPSGKPQPYMAPPGSIAGWNTQPTMSNLNTQYIPPSNIKQNDGANDDVDTSKQKIDAILLKKFARVQRHKQLLQQAQTNNNNNNNNNNNINNKNNNNNINKMKVDTNSTTIPQLDGLGDRKGEADDDEDDEDEEEGSTKGDEELGSDLDDEDDDEEPDTEHIVLCQYEKVTRVKNKRKANLKDGIMHINGRDYVFSKANGEFDW